MKQQAVSESSKCAQVSRSNIDITWKLAVLQSLAVGVRTGARPPSQISRWFHWIDTLNISVKRPRRDLKTTKNGVKTALIRGEASPILSHATEVSLS